MAYERTKLGKDNQDVRADNLNSYVEMLSQSFRNQLQIRNAEEETEFNSLVLAGNMTLDQQLDYRKAQMKRVGDDPSERRRLRDEMSNLKDRIEQQKFTDGWAGKLADFQGGMISVDNVINFLNEQRTATTDQNILNSISQKMAEMQAQKFTLTQEMIRDGNQFAINSKSVEVIKDQIKKVQEHRNDAKLSGNKQLSQMYDLQIQALGNAKNSAEIERQILELGAATATGSYSAVAMLDALNQRTGQSDEGSGPVTINGVTYASAKDFWNNKRSNYIADSSAGGFFAELFVDAKNQIDTKISKNALTIADLQQINSKFNQLLNRGELADYVSNIQTYKQDAMQHGANQLATAITNEFERSLDVNKAVAKLTAVKNLGVNVDKAYTDILQSNAATKNAQVQGILSRAGQIVQANPGINPEQAVQQAIKEGAGFTLSPDEAGSQSEGSIAARQASTFTNRSGTIDPRTTALGAPGGSPGQSGGLPQTGIHVIGASHNGQQAPAGQVYVVKDGTVLLRPADNPTPESGGGGGVSVVGRVHNGQTAPAGQVYVNKGGTILLRPADNPTPELSGGGGSQPSSGGGNIQVIGTNYNGQKAPAGQVFIRKDGVILLRAADNPTPEQTSGGGGGGGGSQPQQQPAKPKVNISVIGTNYNGKKAPGGKVYVKKDGVILLRPADNPTPELN